MNSEPTTNELLQTALEPAAHHDWRNVGGFALLGTMCLFGIFRLLAYLIEVEIESGLPRTPLEQRRRTLLWYRRASWLTLLAGIGLILLLPNRGMLRLLLDSR
jgi:hypothetical protein